jgi:hypothetical protein
MRQGPEVDADVSRPPPGEGWLHELTDQTLFFEAIAKARGANPTRKVSTFVGSFAANRTAVSDREFETKRDSAHR